MDPDGTPPLQLRAVLLDVDETLFDHRRARRAAVRAILEELGAPLRRLREAETEYQRLLDEVHPDVHRGTISRADGRRLRFRRLARWAGRTLTEERAMELAEVAASAYRSHRYPVAGASAFVRSVRRRWPIAVVSNNFEDEQDEKLRVIGLRRWIDVLVVSGSVGWVKPDPRIFQHALSILGVGAAESIMIGDSWESDVLGARSAGVPALWLDRTESGHPPTGRTPRIRSFRPAAAAVRRMLAAHRGEGRRAARGSRTWTATAVGRPRTR